MSEQKTTELTEGGALDRILGDARKRFEARNLIGLSWCSWQQAWGSTSCGFGGIAGQAMTSAQTTVVLVTVDNPQSDGGPWEDIALVYHAGRYAYQIEKLTQEFHSMMSLLDLPGKTDRRKARGFGTVVYENPKVKP